MGHIQWKDSVATGFSQIELQHGELYRLLSRLSRTLETDAGGALPEYRFIQLANETAAHFTAEEDYLQMVGYPDLASHRLEHQRILQGFRENLRRWNGPGAPPLIELVEEFSKANQQHMQTADQAFAEWLLEK